jgi:hypothetical protein
MRLRESFPNLEEVPPAVQLPDSKVWPGSFDDSAMAEFESSEPDDAARNEDADEGPENQNVA